MKAARAQSSEITHLPAGTGAVATTLQSAVRNAFGYCVFGVMSAAQVADVQSYTGSIDLTSAFANAAVNANGKKLYCPSGMYRLNTDSGSTVLDSVCVEGDSVADGTSSTLNEGTIFSIVGTTNSPFKVRSGTSFYGVSFYYPNQVDSATPTAYPPTLDLDFTVGPVSFVTVENCVAYNAYRFFRSSDTGGNVGHIWIEDNTIYGISTCIEIARNLEVIKINGNSFTFSHYAPSTEAGLRGYTRANGIAIKYDYGDGIFSGDNLVFGYLRGYSMGAGNGLLQLTQIIEDTFDEVRYPIYCTGVSNFLNFKIIGCNLTASNSQNNALDGNGVYMDNTGSGIDSLALTGNDFNQSTADAIYITGNTPTRFIVITGGKIHNPGGFKIAGSYSAVNANGALTNVKMTGVKCRGQNNAIVNGISGSMNTLELVGNNFEAFNAALNSVSVNTLMHSGNTSSGTVGATSDVVNSATVNWNVGNHYDKPSGSTTRPAFLARQNAAQTFNSGTLTDILFATTSFDKGTNFASPSFTVPMAGRYKFSWQLTHDTTGTAGDRWVIQLTASAGGAVNQSYKMIADYNSVGGVGILELASGATVKMQIQRASGVGNFVTLNDANATYFCGELVE